MISLLVMGWLVDSKKPPVESTLPDLIKIRKPL